MTTSFRKSSFIVASLALGVAPACGQSYAAASSGISYSLELDPASSGLGSFLDVSDFGLQTYNLITGDPSAYENTAGDAYASASVDPASSFDSSTGNGYIATSSQAEGLSVGTAAASAGGQENLQITNFGTTTILVDISATGGPGGAVSTTGATSSINYANVAADVGINDALVGSQNIQLSGYSDNGIPIITTNSHGWTGSYVISLAGGQTDSLSFFADSAAFAGASQSVPTPSGAAALMTGCCGLGLIRRRRLGARKLESAQVAAKIIR